MSNYGIEQHEAKMKKAIAPFQMIGRTVIALLLIGGFLGVPRSRADAEKQPLHVFDRVGVNIFVPVTLTDLDGHSETVDFIVDTGTNRTTIDLSVARRLSLRPSSVSRNTTTNGMTLRYTTKVPNLCSLSQCSQYLEALVDDLSLFTKGYGRQVGGLLAMDFFQHYTLLIDFPNSQIGLFPAGTKLNAFSKWMTVEITFQEGLPLVPITLPNGKNARLAFDTGFDSLVDALLYESLTGRLTFKRTGETEVKTFNGSDSLQVGEIEWIRIGKRRLAPAFIQLSNRTPAEMSEVESAGQIGLFPFEEDIIVLDYSNKELLISSHRHRHSTSKSK